VDLYFIMHLPKDMLEVYDVYSTLTFTYVHMLVLIYLTVQCTVTDHFKKLTCCSSHVKHQWFQTEILGTKY